VRTCTYCCLWDVRPHDEQRTSSSTSRPKMSSSGILGPGTALMLLYRDSSVSAASLISPAAEDSAFHRRLACCARCDTTTQSDPARTYHPCDVSNSRSILLLSANHYVIGIVYGTQDELMDALCWAAPSWKLTEVDSAVRS